MGTDGEAGFSATDFDDDAGGFVPKNTRGRDEAVMNFFDVGGTHSTDGDFYQEFIWADGRDRNGFEAKVIGAAIDDGAHGFRNIEHRKDLNRTVNKGTKIKTVAQVNKKFTAIRRIAVNTSPHNLFVKRPVFSVLTRNPPIR